MSSEEILCEGSGVKVTPARVIVRGTTYAVANITSIAAVKDTSMRTQGIVVIVLGVALVVAELTILGAAALLLGALIAWLGKSAILVLTTGAAERRALRSRNEALVVDIASAINLATTKRAALRG
jgi:Na+-transporting methylmalonyl-CoA/oxaloacetate decarboxylase gamma subunit